VAASAEEEMTAVADADADADVDAEEIAEETVTSGPPSPSWDAW